LAVTADGDIVEGGAGGSAFGPPSEHRRAKRHALRSPTDWLR